MRTVVGVKRRSAKGSVHRVVEFPTARVLDAAGRRRQRLACWTCGRETAPMHLRLPDFRGHGWEPGQTLQIPDWTAVVRRQPDANSRDRSTELGQLRDVEHEG